MACHVWYTSTMFIREITKKNPGYDKVFTYHRLMESVRTPEGPACHTGSRTCFYRKLGKEGTEPKDIEPADTGMVGELFHIIKERQRTRTEGSYTSRLFDGGIDRIGKKVIEEAGEVLIAAKNGELSPLAGEMADLWFHSLILLAACGLSPEDVWAELRRPPSSEYLLLDDQPARATPYTPMEVSAKTTSSPALTSAITSGVAWPKMRMVPGPKGIRANTESASVMVRKGARK